MLIPKEIPVKKNHIKLPKGNEIKKAFFVRGTVGLLSLNFKYIKPFELEAVRKIVVRYIRKNKRFFTQEKPFIYFRIFPFVSLTTKPKAVRMGKGKGSHALWVYPIKKGAILLEIHGMNEILSLELLNKVRSKLSVKTKVIRSINF